MQMLVGEERDQPDPGRTTTAQDDRFIRVVHSLHPVAAGLLALAVYAAWGVALPLWIGSSGAWRLSFNTEGAVFAAAVFFAWLFPVIEGRLRHQRLELTTDLRTLSAREFEELAGELFRREGWDVVETGGHGQPDGNVDLLLSRGSERRIVQCKRWTSRDVGVDQIRAFGGTLLREGCAGRDGIFVTSAQFTSFARDEADRLRMELIDGRDFVRRLERVGAQGLLSAAKTGAAAWLCPECATPMLLDRSSHGWWLRCPNYNAGCRGKHDLGHDSRAVVERLIAGV
jgi:HJR/Mrr/RecB family endonuclease